MPLPKTYSEQEREYIDKRLREEAMNCMAAYGIRKTTVDELVRRVRIPKGTFYLFYESKEQLLFQVLMEFHKTIEKQLLEKAESLAGRKPDVEAVTDMLMDFFMKAETFVGKLFPAGSECAPELADQFGGAFRNIFTAMVYSHEGGKAADPGALRLLIRGLVLQLFEREAALPDNQGN